MFKIFNNKYKAEEPKEIKEEAKQEIKEDNVYPIKETKWIWVEGYKGTDKDMKCRDFQYELNNSFKTDDEIELCNKGFHFCEDLDDVFNYYDLSSRINNNRYFKVKALVKEGDYNKMRDNKGKWLGINGGLMRKIGSQLVSKEIIFLEELQYEDLKEYIDKNIPFIKTKEDFYNLKDIGYKSFSRNKFVSNMMELGFSEVYSLIQYDKIDSRFSHNDLNEFLNKVKAYKEEGISKDLMVYLLEK